MPVNSIPGKSLAEVSGGATGKVESKNLGQQDFLKLMVEQMRNQNPLEPQDNSQFVAQIAQFDTLSAVREMAAAIKTLAQVSELANASALMGKEVKASVPGEPDKQTGMPGKAEDVAGKVTKVAFGKGGASVYIGDRAVPAQHITEVA